MADAAAVAALAAGVGGLIDEVKEGVGHVRERTIEIGARVLWVDNIGSLVIVRGAADLTPIVVGAILLLVSLIVFQSEGGGAVGALVAIAGVALIFYGIQKKVYSGLSIGTCDGRRTLIVSSDEPFLQQTLEFLREKIDTGSITLQGTFDIGSMHVNSSGGGVVIGRSGVASGAQANINVARAPSPAPASTLPQVTASETIQSQAPTPPPPIDRAAPASLAYTSFEPIDVEQPKRGIPLAATLAAGLLIVTLIGGGYLWWRDQQAQAMQAAWDAVPRTDATALRAYITEAPETFRDDAEAALTALEQSRYNNARRADSIATLEAFVAEFPESENVAAARGRIAELQTIQAFSNSTPTLIAPLDQAVFNHFPRNTLLQWAPLPGATTYFVEIQMFDPFARVWVEAPESVTTANVPGSEQFVFSFVGAQPGRWRVRGEDRNGTQSRFSEWRTFQYTR